ncbi:hypothetical protein SOV_13320 [Sporomusa ovata DSM 2662]|uniref:(S)-2-(Hydroxymethyl)glutarate dehydratase n=1 Tax=Sporomusa ovata TaxID=2378 RepID=A0A0U1KZ10_9FIRM|nr:hypothetical protein [Sporomusa ovata]EQB28942.1 2-hydroxymethyl glutarate dehydratase [Sporomusa ovata DSM 2662]CQR72369.1 (S)-2-(hydroxymethyl)glutarate dehydratase [Sporomusa ovata]
MNEFLNLMNKRGYVAGCLTIGDCIELAKELNVRVSDIVIREAMVANKMTREEVTSSVMATFCHNLYAMEMGLTSGKSFIMGTVGQDLADEEVTIIGDRFVNKILKYTLAAQVGNHVVGLMPCAGTGDSCTYTGLVKALLDTLEDQQEVARLVALLLKVGVIFRAGKSTTGCNMEGFGAGAAATAAVVAEMLEATPDQVGQAITLALSPTIANPCTPRVMVAGLCAAHLGGGVLIGHLTANLVVKTNLPVTVPPDVMIALAAAVHPLSAKHIVPTVIKYMEPFFKTNEAVEYFVSQETKEQDAERIKTTIQEAQTGARALAAKANSIIKPFGDAVVGGSSQAVGSPTNTARIAHALAEGEITGVKVELYPELFARRGINIPGMLMAAVHGAGTDNAGLYRQIMSEVIDSKLQVEIVEVDEPQLQRVTIYATRKNAMIEALNRGGGRLVIKNALPSVAEAKAAARKLHIEVVE